MRGGFLTRKAFLVPVLALVLGAAFLPVLGNGFAWDDDIHILDNPLWKPVTFQSIERVWKAPYLNLYIPVTYTGWALLSLAGSEKDAATGEYTFNPRVFHAASLALHALCAALVFLLVLALFKSPGAAFFAALLFGLHPVQVEAVAWASELKTLLCGLFFFGSLALLAAFHRARNHAAFLYALSLASFALALLSKPMAVVAPLFVLVIQHFFLDVRPRKNLLLALPFFALVVPLMLLTASAQPPGPEQFVPGLPQRVLVAGDAAAFYLLRLAWPFNLAIDYGHTPEWVLSQWWGNLAWLLPAALLLILWRFRSRTWPFLGACLVFLVGFAPVSGLVPFVFQRISTVADRYLYFSMLAPALALGCFLSHSGRKWAFFGPAVALVILGSLSFAQARHWKDDQALFIRAASVNPRSAISWNNLAGFYKTVTRERLEMYKKALRHKPDYRDAMKNLAEALLAIKKEAPTAVLGSLVDPRLAADAPKFLEQGTRLAREGKPREAVGFFGLTLFLDMASAPAHNNLGKALLLTGNPGNARVHFELAAAIEPENAFYWNNLGAADILAWDPDKALSRLATAARLDPALPGIQANLAVAEKLKRDPKAEIPAPEVLAVHYWPPEEPAAP